MERKEGNRTMYLVFSDPKATLVVVVFGLGLLAGLVYGAWWAMSHVPLTAARIWALVATVAIFVVGRACYKLGHTGSQARLQGIDDGLDKVARAGAQAVDLRGQAAFTMRRAAQPAEPVIELPRLEANYRVLDALPSGEEVELG